MSKQVFGAVEIDEAFYQRFTELNVQLGEAERDLIYYTEGLSVLEKKLMERADENFYKSEGKRLPEYLQRREAKSHPEFINMVRAKARAQEAKVVLKGQVELMKMKFDEWRTRSADRRNTI
jgi:hypothetical protein